MSLVSITRMRPNDLQEVQIQANVTANGAITDVIASLQSGRSTQQAPLNTACPTCAVDGVPMGFVSAAAGTITARIPCPTCAGYLLYHTAQGAVTPPANPFNAPLVVRRLLPADLKEAIVGFPAATTLSAMITALQGNFDVPATNNCPQCTHTGWILVRNIKTTCPLCTGWQKTVFLYVLTNGRYTRSNG